MFEWRSEIYPLAHDDVCSGSFAIINHIFEILLFLEVEFFVIFSIRDVNVMLCLRFGRLEGAGENSNFGIMDFFGHLGM